MSLKIFIAFFVVVRSNIFIGIKKGIIIMIIITIIIIMIIIIIIIIIIMIIMV